MITRHRTDRDSIDEITSPLDALPIAQQSPPAVLIATHQQGRQRKFTFTSSDADAPVSITVETGD